MALSIQTQLTRPTVTYIEGKVQGYLVAALIDATAWQIGDAIHQLFMAFVFTIWNFTGLTTAAIRGGYLDTALDSTDPGGDPDGPNWLSDLGASTYNTERGGATFATTLMHVHNGSAFTYAIHVGDSVQNAVTGKTYTFEDDSIHYVASTYNIPPQGMGVYTVLPVIASEIGSDSSAAASDISILSSVLLGVTVTNPSAAIGTEIEDADVYRERCREAQSATSPNGIEDAYLYLARTTPGGKPLLRISDGAPVSVTRTQVIASNPVGTIDLYLADADGGSDASTGGDVDTATANLLKYCDPLTDTLNVHSATDTVIAITYTVKLDSKKAPGVSDTDAEAIIAAALAAYFPLTQVGGDDQDAVGQGVIYTEDFRGVIRGALFGLYGCAVTTPSGPTTTIGVGHVPTLGTIIPTVTVV